MQLEDTLQRDLEDEFDELIEEAKKGGVKVTSSTCNGQEDTSDSDQTIHVDMTKEQTPEEQLQEIEDLYEKEKRRKGKHVVIAEEETKVIYEDSLHTVIPKPKVKEFRRVVNRLYNISIVMEILGLQPFTIRTILDTSAATCCINQDSVPNEALEPSAYPIFINGVNSRQQVNTKLKNGQIIIGKNRFRIPFTYAFPMGMKDGIDMLIGCNFIRSMQGGLRIKGNSITFYKNITSIATSAETEIADCAIPELNLEELEYREIQRMCLITVLLATPNLSKDLTP